MLRNIFEWINDCSDFSVGTFKRFIYIVSYGIGRHFSLKFCLISKINEFKSTNSLCDELWIFLSVIHFQLYQSSSLKRYIVQKIVKIEGTWSSQARSTCEVSWKIEKKKFFLFRSGIDLAFYSGNIGRQDAFNYSSLMGILQQSNIVHVNNVSKNLTLTLNYIFLVFWINVWSNS